MNTQQNNKIFQSDNFQLACYLASESVPLLSLDKTNPKRVVFVFEESEQRKILTQQFLTYKAKVEPHRFFSAQKDLKQMIYQNR
ncbi:hypothetical protein A2115_03510 [Candidatus Woesebacteria bacterium GWA1_41_8]|uniref:DUF5659 domain-containing protein n=1 Tax=Candidatus Woesebacteria bacterium GWA1_41_8 TaxID=1802471 RepID=A0A1F7WIM4_9BACT|nr:MAG: hypothetical protein A2115_03510 [Candidatus Woesebacteria bacterium GWA1_41_8]